jgi:predicted Zn-dependent protease with MMP-like domain
VGRRARIVLYRRPLELRALDREDLEDLVHDIVVEEVAHFLGLDPHDVDPDGFPEE